MRRTRIVKRTNPGGCISYVIQQKHDLFWWWWVDAWINSWCGASCVDYFDTLKDAERNLCYFDGTKTLEEIIFAS